MQESLLNLKTYKALQRATEYILSSHPKSYAYLDYERAPLAYKAYEKWKNKEKITKDEEKALLAISYLPKESSQLDSHQFEKLYKAYGEGTSRIRVIDANLSEWLNSTPARSQILTTGGACALESIDSKIIMYLQQQTKDKDAVKNYITEIIQSFPTWTQITGTLIPGEGLSVMYDETYPWYLRLEEYGIPDAKTVTQQIYDDIYIRVRRWVKLYNPNNKVVKIPFSKLDLIKKGCINQWLEQYKPYLEELDNKYGKVTDVYDLASFHKAWIQYTYFGPHILHLNLELIKEMYPNIYEEFSLDTANIHVRSKQIDHLDIERMHSWMHAILLENFESKKLKDNKHLLTQPYYRLGLAMYMWMRDNFEKNKSNGFVGFLDTTFKGVLLHEDHFFTRKEIRESVTIGNGSHLYDSPLRLNAQNYNEVITFLDRFKNPNSVSFSKNIMISLVETKEKIKKTDKKMRAVDKIITFFEKVSALLLEGSLAYDEKDKKTPEQYIKDVKNNLYKRYHSNKYLIYRLHKMYPQGFDFKKLLDEVFDLVEISDNSFQLSKNKKNEPFVALFGSVISKYVSLDKERVAQMKHQKQELDVQLKYYSQAVVNDITQSQSDDLTKYVQILPLSDNLFVSYMQQLLFIPSVRNAYLDIAKVAQKEDLDIHVKEELIIDIIQKIFPVVTSAISYVFRGGDYPWKERFEYQYRSNL